MKSEYKGFKPGDRIKLIHMIDEQAVPDGTKGTIDHIDDIGQLHVNWDNGRHIAVILGLDSIEKIES